MTGDQVAELRRRMGLTRRELARGLRITDRTVIRWEDEGGAPTGLADEVLSAIDQASRRMDPLAVGRLVNLGIGALIHFGLIAELDDS